MKATQEKQHQPRSGRSVSVRRSARQVKTYRSPSGRPVAATAWAAAAGTLCWLAGSGEPGAALEAAPWLVLGSWFVYAAQWRPCLRADSDGFELINGLRDHQIPFNAVMDIEIGYAVVVRAAGRKYVSWGAPTPPGSFESGFGHVSDLKSRPFSILPSNERISQPVPPSGRDEIAQAWQDARAASLPSSGGTVAAGSTVTSDSTLASGSTVTSTCNRPLIALGVIAILWVIAAVVF